MQTVRVLLVEDNLADVLLLREALKDQHLALFDVADVPRLQDARKRLDAERFNVVLLDLGLPDSQGLDTCTAMRTYVPSMPIVVLTGSDDEAVGLQAIREGVQDYLSKNLVRGHELARAIRYAIERKAAEEALRSARDELELRVRERTLELQQANDALKDSARRKDEFIAMLGHELRNPLAPIWNAAHLLKAVSASHPDVRQLQEIIERQIEQMRRLVDDLLDVSRVTRDKIALLTERLDWAHLVRTQLGDFCAGMGANQRVELEANLPLEPLWVLGDRTRLCQVLSNLLGNAQKFSNPGGRVLVALEPDAGAAAAVLTVRDSGIGMSPDVQAHLFEPFSQGEVGLARERGGLGLGLALVKGLVELHKGSIQVFSAGPGRGTEVKVTLPLVEQSREATQAQPPQPPVRSLRILIIEDNEDAAESLSMLMQLAGHAVQVAADGAHGLELASASMPQAILCDIGLPGVLDGYAVARAIRAAPDGGAVKLIAMSGYSQDEVKQRATQSGFDLHLTKPVDPGALKHLLAQLSAP